MHEFCEFVGSLFEIWSWLFFKWRTVELWTLSLGHFLCPKICLCGSSVLLKLTNRDYWNLSPGHFPYSISLFSYDGWYTLTNYKRSKLFFGTKKYPKIFALKCEPFYCINDFVTNSGCIRRNNWKRTFSVALIPELGKIVKPELSHLLSELRNRSISEVLELFQWKAELCESSWGWVGLG